MVLDASFCISFLVSNDVHHAQSARWLERRAVAGTLFIAPSLLLVEVAGAIARRTGVPEDGHRALDHLRKTVDIRFIPLDLARAEMAAKLAADLRLRGADATYVAVAQENSVSLVTWDSEQRARAAGIVQVLTPDFAFDVDQSGLR
jgi:predicted nucleic acid-binding protein